MANLLEMDFYNEYFTQDFVDNIVKKYSGGTGVAKKKDYREVIAEMQDGAYIDLRNIEKNKVAQDYLLGLVEEGVPPAEIFEKVYQNRSGHAERRKEARAMQREENKSKKSKEKSSYLDTPEREEAFYDNLTIENTKDTMTWLAKELAKRDKKKNDQGPAF